MAEARQHEGVIADSAFQAALQLKTKYQLQDCWSSFARELQTYPAWGGDGDRAS